MKEEKTFQKILYKIKNLIEKQNEKVINELINSRVEQLKEKSDVDAIISLINDQKYQGFIHPGPR